MSTVAFVPPGERPRQLALSALGTLGALLLAGGLVVALQSGAPPLPLLLAGGLALVGLLFLTVARLDAAVTLGFLVLGVVRVEPAPADAVFALVIAVTLVTGRLRLVRVPASMMVLAGLLAVLNIISLTEAVDTIGSVRYFAITFYLLAFAIWLTSYVDSPARARRVVRAYLAVAIASAVAGSLAWIVPFPGSEVLLTGDGSRVRALFKDPNVFGPFLVLAAMILLEERLRPRLLRLRPNVNALALSVLALGVLLSFSRAAWLNYVLAAVVTLATIAVRRSGGARAVRVLVLALFATAAAAAVLGLTGQLTFLQERAQTQSYDTERFAAQREGLVLAERYPIGVGPGQFEEHYDLATHSTYVRVLVEQGFAGLLAFLALAVGTLTLALRNALTGRDTWGIGSAALLGCWCGLLLNSAVVDTLHWRHLWVVAALIWAATLRAAYEGTRSTRSRRSLSARMPV